ncbi:hypothetical protein D3C72_576160 [compost metagenome]
MVEQHAVGGHRAPADPAAQLVQLGQPQPLRVLDDHQAGIGHVYPHLDDCGGDQQLQDARLELLHHPLLLDRAHPAMDQAYVQAGQPGLQLGGRVFGGLALQHLGLLDQGADPVGLLALGAGEFHPLDHILTATVRQGDSSDGGAAGRQLVDDGGVEIRIGGHRQGAGNGGGGHDQLMGMHPLPLPFFAQGEALVHPEPVLFVDDHQGQALEHHLLLEDGVGAHHHLDAAVGNGGQRLLPRLALLLARQPAHLDAEGCQPVGEVDGVLFGQQFGRRHQPHLAAVAYGLQRRQGRDQRLA